MNKYIEKVEKYKEQVLNAALEKLRSEYEEAEDFYNDTGYDRYFNKMQRREMQIDEIEAYRKRGKTVKKECTTSEYKELLELRQAMKDIKSKVFYLSKELPLSAELVSLQDILRDVR